SETGAFDVSIASNGIALTTTRGGEAPLRQVDLITNAITNRKDCPGSGGGGSVGPNTQIHHSSDGARLYLLEGVSNGPEFTYSATTDTFGPANITNDGGSIAAAVSRDGSILGL